MSGEQAPFYLTATFWKRFSVFMSIALSAASLILSAIASLKESGDMLKSKIPIAFLLIPSFLSLSSRLEGFVELANGL